MMLVRGEEGGREGWKEETYLVIQILNHLL